MAAACASRPSPECGCSDVLTPAVADSTRSTGRVTGCWTARHPRELLGLAVRPSRRQVTSVCVRPSCTVAEGHRAATSSHARPDHS